jgi:hypothetical protein
LWWTDPTAIITVPKAKEIPYYIFEQSTKSSSCSKRLEGYTPFGLCVFISALGLGIVLLVLIVLLLLGQKQKYIQQGSYFWKNLSVKGVCKMKRLYQMWALFPPSYEWGGNDNPKLGVQIGYNVVHLRTSLVELFVLLL